MKTDNEFTTIPGLANESIFKLNPFSRALGRMVELNPLSPIEPGTAEADLMGDSFFNYYQNPPARDDIPLSRELNKSLIDWVRDSKLFEQSAEAIRGDVIASAFSASTLTEQLLNDPTVKEAIEKQKQAEAEAKKQAEAEAAKQAAEAAGNKQAANQFAKQAEAAGNRAEAAMQAAREAMNKLQNSPKGNAIKAEAVKKAAEAGKEAGEIARGWGLDGSATGAGGDINDVLKTMNQYRDLLPVIAKLIGRVRGISLKAIKDKPKDTRVIVNAGYTRELINLFPSERALLNPSAPGIMRAIKTAEYANRGLVGMITGSESTRAGSIFLLVDESGSMGGGRMIKAGALAIGIMQAGKENNQPGRAVRFCHQIGDAITSESPLDESMKWASQTARGGTNFDNAINHAIDQLSGDAEAAEKSDLVMITDAEADLSDSTIARLSEFKNTSGTRFFIIGVGDSGLMDGIASITDKYISMGDDIPLDKIAEQLAGEIWN